MTTEQILDSLVMDDKDRNMGYIDPLMNEPDDLNKHKKLYSDLNAFKVLNKLYHEKNITQRTKFQNQLMQVQAVMRQKEEINKLSMNRQKISPEFQKVLKYKGEDGELLKLYQYSNAQENKERNLFETSFNTALSNLYKKSMENK